jgi:NMD protein affecting ribosome stability and mRNA decay
MTIRHLSRARLHRHTAVTKKVLDQRAGVPYEVERTFCSACSAVLAERPLKRAAA